MVNKQEIADSLQTSIGAILDATRYIRLSGTIDEASEYSPLVDGGLANRAIFIAPYACKVKSFIIRAEILETAGGTVDLKKVASGTALSSATKVITTVVPTDATLDAATNYSCEVLTTANVNHLAEGDTLVVITADITELSGVMYNAVIERLN